MSYEFYKILHLVGIFSLFMALGGLLLHQLQGGPKSYPMRSWLMMFHGLGLTLIFVAGFGLIAKSQVQTPWPGWLWCKFLIWIVMGISSLLITRFSAIARGIWFIVIFLGGFAAYLAIVKPF